MSTEVAATRGSPETASGPRAEYVRRLDQRRAVAAHYARRDWSIGNARLTVFLSGVALAWLVGTRGVPAAWLAVPVTAFLGLVVIHDQVIRIRRRAERAVAFYERGLARLDDQWAGRGDAGDRFADASHPYAADLDLFGRGSLFELLSTARTRAGEDTLAAWLRSAARPDEVRARQAAVAELRPQLDLREDLALLGADVRAGLHAEALATWGRAPQTLASKRARWIAAGLALVMLATLLAWATTTIGPLPFAAVCLVEGIFALPFRARVLRVIRAAEQPAQELALFSQLLSRLEREPFTAPRLVALRRALDVGGRPPSEQIARLSRLLHLLDARKNQLFAPLASLLLWATQLAFAIEAWRATSGPVVADWLATVGEFEALCALAGYTYEHPEDPFPEIVDAAPRFDGEGLGHPLIPLQRCVRNDVRLEHDLRVLIVSGSNMSGKSTLLRTVGINVVLALAGAPVRATRLRLSPLAVGASIRIVDSLQAGSSHFYAEITRLRQLVNIAQASPPLLFLLDELFHGTNSHDRRVGAQAVVRGLVEKGAIGLVTTHDLALAQLADTLAPAAANVHFEDHLEDGRMVFDYRMRSGVVEKSNALALMRAVGLEV